MKATYALQRRVLLAACDWNRYVYHRGLNTAAGFLKLKTNQAALVHLRKEARRD